MIWFIVTYLQFLGRRWFYIHFVCSKAGMMKNERANEIQVRCGPVHWDCDRTTGDEPVGVDRGRSGAKVGGRK